MMWFIVIVFMVFTFVYYSDVIESFVGIGTDEPVLRDLQRQLSTIHPRIATLELYEGKRSYTVNKQRVYICLKDKDGNYYGRNMLIYVILHEFAHVLCEEIGHTERFMTIFNALLRIAENRGLYDPDLPPTTDYCEY